MTQDAKKSESQKKTKPKVKKADEIKSESPYDVGPVIEVYNNMRCGFIMPRAMLTHVLKAEDSVPLADNVLYSKKAKVESGGSFRIKKGALDQFIKTNSAIRNFVESNCLKIVGKKDVLDIRDAIDAPHKVEPSQSDMRNPDGKPLSIIQTEAVELKVNPSRQLK